jgi:hypothetical protein
MRLSVPRLEHAALLIACCCILSAQTQEPAENSDQKLYEQFFRKVVELRQISDNPNVILANGISTQLIVRKLQDVFGLTDSEVTTLSATAADCQEKLRYLMEHRPSVFEARLQRIESGRISPALAREFEELDREHTRVVLSHREELRTALGNERFRLIDDVVHAPNWDREMTPMRIKPARKQ